MIFQKVFLEDIIEGHNIIEDKPIAHTRWAVRHRAIFQYEDKFYVLSYEVPATEYQEWDPFNGEKEVDCQEVKPIQKTITVYE